MNLNNKEKKYNLYQKKKNIKGIIKNIRYPIKIVKKSSKESCKKSISNCNPKKNKKSLRSNKKSLNNISNRISFTNIKKSRSKNKSLTNNQILNNMKKKIHLINKCYNKININKDSNLNRNKKTINSFIKNNFSKFSYSQRINKKSFKKNNDGDNFKNNFYNKKLSSLEMMNKNLKIWKKKENSTNKLTNRSISSFNKKINKPKNLDGVKIIKNILNKTKELPYFENCKVNSKAFGCIDSFSVNTHKGIVRNYNEDRVSILLNAQQRFDSFKNSNISSCSIFSVFDGHGGIGCCNYLKENLHNKILKNIKFDNNIELYLKKSFINIDNNFCNNYKINNEVDTSGTCAIMALIMDKKLIIANTGDSRCLISQNKGEKVKSLSIDHKPEIISEFNRIIKYNGELYRLSSNLRTNENEIYSVNNYNDIKKLSFLDKKHPNMCVGPWRINPGGLSVSRTFGDIESKIEIFGGKNNVVTAEPEIFQHNIKKEDDFIILASDGVFDRLSNKEIVQIVWGTVDYYKVTYDNPSKKYENWLSDIVNNILKKSLIKESEDNITLILINFKNLFK